MYGSWLALCVGLLLLFSAIVAWINFKEILSGKSREDRMASYLVIGKKITDQAMIGPAGISLFTNQEIEALQQLPGVKEVGALTANNFPVSANMGGNLGFYTELFLGSVDSQYLDVQPEDWAWQPGQVSLPVIMSTDFLNLYNYGFALSQGLPQLSQSSVKSLPFEIQVARGQERYRARIVGFTDRISSILVPESFMQAMNRKYAAGQPLMPSRLVVKVDDPSENTFVNFLKTKGYTTNEEQLRWSRIRTAVNAVVTSVGLVALVVVGMSVLAFLLFVELSVQRAATHIRLMKQIGFAPRLLKKILNRFFFPWICSAVLFAALLTFLLHITMVQWLRGMELSVSVSAAWPLAVIVALMLAGLFLLLQRSIRRMLKQV
jgi:hypothetical protein